jgi:uncharacterized damage-inducible protein DinB
MTNEEIFISFSANKLTQLAGRIATCMDQLSEDQIWARNSGNENAIGNLVLHLCGNVRQWIGYGAAGKSDIRERDREFAARGGIEAPELKKRLAAVVQEAADIIRGLTTGRLAERTTIQSYNVTVLEAVYHVVEHFSQHTGQIIFATKLLTGAEMGFYRHLHEPEHAEQVP